MSGTACMRRCCNGLENMSNCIKVEYPMILSFVAAHGVYSFVLVLRASSLSPWDPAYSERVLVTENIILYLVGYLPSKALI